MTDSATTNDATLDVIVRFHDVRRLAELDRCIFSVIGQRYRPLNIYLTVQRFTSEMIAETRARLAPLLDIDPTVALTILNWEQPEPVDARSALINLGLAGGRGRYVAFLDYDDTLYPEAYALLVAQLNAEKAAIAFGGICIKIVDVSDFFSQTVEKRLPFIGHDLIDLFRDNFCPIHSFVIDRSRVPAQFLRFEPLMTRGEDYDFLLRICSQVVSDFAMMRSIIGDYYYKNDGSNTITRSRAKAAEADLAGARAASFIEQRRRITPVSAEVQRSLGLKPVPGLTIRDLLGADADAFDPELA